MFVTQVQDSFSIWILTVKHFFGAPKSITYHVINFSVGWQSESIIENPLVGKLPGSGELAAGLQSFPDA